jgi:predicted RNA binding protein YcfA (HicA-like mRNA interferase family)
MPVELNTRKIIRRLEAEGWVNVGGGEHTKFIHPAKPGRIIVPRHTTQSVGVAKKIARAAGWTTA